MTNEVIDAPRPEWAIVVDMARLGLLLGPILVAVGAIFWGFDGFWSSVLAFVLVLANLAIGATIIERAAAISLNALMGAVLGGFIGRLLLLSVVVVPLRNAAWFEAVPFAIALVGGHLGLLTWEAQRVSTRLAGPGPAANRPTPSTSLRLRSESE
jgi:choline-glycine betaine transporter